MKPPVQRLWQPNHLDHALVHVTVANRKASLYGQTCPRSSIDVITITWRCIQSLVPAETATAGLHHGGGRFVPRNSVGIVCPTSAFLSVRRSWSIDQRRSYPVYRSNHGVAEVTRITTFPPCIIPCSRFLPLYLCRSFSLANGEILIPTPLAPSAAIHPPPILSFHPRLSILPRSPI